MPRKIAQWLTVLLGVLTVAGAPAQARLFESDSKQLGNSKMDIVVREVERRPRASLVEIKTNSVGSSVGSSFFILCSLRRLAALRGDYRYIVKIEDQRRSQMLVGFLQGPEEPLSNAGPEFKSLNPRKAVIDLQQFAPICDSMK